MALGRSDKEHFRVMIDQAKILVVDGSDLGLEIKEMNLPAELRAAMERDNDRVGLTLTIQNILSPYAFARTGTSWKQ